MQETLKIIAALVVVGALAGCSSDDASPSFVGSWVQTQPSGATFLWVIEEDDGAYAASVYTDQADWCGDLPYWSQFRPELVDDVTLKVTGITNQCYGDEELSNSFFETRLILDPEADTMRDAADPEGWNYERDSSTEPGDLYPFDEG